MVIFSAFLYKPVIKNPDIYKRNIMEFISKKLPNTEVEIYLPLEIPKEESRDMVIDKILYDTEESNMSDLVVFKFKTPIKEINIQIDLGNPEKYELFLYG